jgi:hypothetical protein
MVSMARGASPPRWEEYDSNAGGVGLAVINPIVE